MGCLGLQRALRRRRRRLATLASVLALAAAVLAHHGAPLAEHGEGHDLGELAVVVLCVAALPLVLRAVRRVGGSWRLPRLRVSLPVPAAPLTARGPGGPLARAGPDLSVVLRR